LNLLTSGTVKVIQITDTHLFATDELDIFGVKSNLKFKEVVDKILDEDSHDADMIFLTGDISQDETADSYQKVISILAKINLPIYWIPGNHDNIAQLESVFKNAKNCIQGRNLLLAHWNLIFLNTKMDGTAEGYLSQSELQFLENTLRKNDNKTAIVMHHHPAPVGTPFIDSYILRNRDEFWDIVTGSKVQLIICGHVHGDYKFKYNNIVIESSPATCLQWQKGTKNLEIDTKIGYKIYYFHHDHYSTVSKLW
jgi:3',5'-cyclic-AMP phosphodiesterase